MNAIEINNVSKNFGDTLAVNDVSLKIPQGTIYGLLGPNGAGKSTIMKMLSTLITPTSGDIKIFNHDIKKNKKEIKKMISLVSDYTVLEEDLTPEENLKMFAIISGLKKEKYENKIKKLIEDFGLNIYKQKLTKHLSSGNKQKLNIARALVKSPKILLLDEPTNAIDVETSKFIREYIINENTLSNVTVLISSHYIWEIEQISSNIAVILNGKIAINEKTEKIYKEFDKIINMYEFKSDDVQKLKNIIDKLKNDKNIINIRNISKNKIIIESKEKILFDNDKKDISTKKINPNLEDIYSYIVKNS
ncbi:MAG: type transport system ATP-binding protein [Oceanotoga sp.]|jgi:ABC-2 type transport system ATP-binding protein|uniref:ABC-2 type transport system ATP-binding protein n=1 Tax=Oceanotoga teriensis TaxID=515440 RepID=A0AA45C625_9BACT|nr:MULTISPECIES: ABC transporter ATP-binding protein [Oceanotoga]MDN5341780.1 type transport system ATP-binding protein [Oceanotoga sp.]PWJ90559.1 ABC-2 type transport system ATP-binding protein [Oceanotoga teriensis]